MLSARPYRPEDRAAVVALGADPILAGAQETPRAWVLERAGEPVAFVASRPRAGLLGGEEAVFAEVAPPAVAAEERASLAADGSLERLAAAMVDASYGPGADRALVALVHEDDWRLHERLFRLEVVRTLPLLRRGARSARSDGWEPIDAAGADQEVRWVWDRCAGAWGACTRRGPEELARLLEASPRACALGVRDGGGFLRGVAVVAPGHRLAPEACVLVDWLVPPGEPSVGERLLAAAASVAAEHGGDLAAYLPPWSPWFGWLQDQGFLVEPSPFVIASRTEGSRHDAFWLRDHWFHTPADFAS